MYIAKYEEGNQFNHDERRTRKLLLHKKEIKKLQEKVFKLVSDTVKNEYKMFAAQIFHDNNETILNIVSEVKKNKAQKT